MQSEDFTRPLAAHAPCACGNGNPDVLCCADRRFAAGVRRGELVVRTLVRPSAEDPEVMEQETLLAWLVKCKRTRPLTHRPELTTYAGPTDHGIRYRGMPVCPSPIKDAVGTRRLPDTPRGARIFMTDRGARWGRHELLLLDQWGHLLDRDHTALRPDQIAALFERAGIEGTIAVLVRDRVVRGLVVAGRFWTTRIVPSAWTGVPIEEPVERPMTMRVVRAIIGRFNRMYGAKRRVGYEPLRSVTAYGKARPLGRSSWKGTPRSLVATGPAARREAKAQIGGNLYRATLDGRTLAYIVAKSMRAARRVDLSDRTSSTTLGRKLARHQRAALRRRVTFAEVKHLELLVNRPKPIALLYA